MVKDKKALSHQVALPHSDNGDLKFLESPYDRRKKLYNFI